MIANDVTERSTGGLRLGAMAAGVIGIAICLIAYFVLPAEQVLRAYLVGWIYWLGISLGCMALLLLHNLTGGAWGELLRRPITAAALTPFLMALLFIPIALGMQHIFPWADPSVMAHDELLQKKAGYLNREFFLWRAVGYFVIWVLGVLLVRRRMHRVARNPDPRGERVLRVRSGQFLLLYGLTMTFASVDWMMSLEPHWFSMIYGVLIVVGQGLSGLVFAIAFSMSYEPTAAQQLGQKRIDLGNLFLAFTMLWAYMSFSQFLIIWYGNLPEEITWYIARIRGAWLPVALAIVVLHFAVPFFLLLSRDIKLNTRHMAWLALGMLVMRWVETLWLIQPAFHPGELYIPWLDLAATAGIGGVWLSFVLSWLDRTKSERPALAGATP